MTVAQRGSPAAAAPRHSGVAQVLALVGFLAVCFSVAGLGGWWTAGSVATWYPTLNKPSWTPPGWLFGPVWSALYAMMAVAAWLVWRRAGVRGGAVPLGLFALQLALNLAWSGLFFALRRPDLGVLDVTALWLAIVATLDAFARVHRVAAALMVPYLLWVTFASALNIAVWRLNLP